MAPKPKSKWLTAIPMVYREGAAFWEREAGLLCLAFQKIGIESQMVALGPSQVCKDKPLILGDLSDFEQASWWKRWGMDGVVLNSWGNPVYEPVARAIKEAGGKLIVRLDSDGMKSPRTHFAQFLKANYYARKDVAKPFAGPYALAKTIAYRYSSAYDRGLCRHFEHADAVAVEFPLAREMLARYLRGLGRHDLAKKLQLVVQFAKDEFAYDRRIPKQPKVLAVGRWGTYQKDAGKLMDVLRHTLPENPDYSADIIGSGCEKIAEWHSHLPQNLRAQIKVHGVTPHEEIGGYYQRSQILLFTSRYEGSPIAAAEALSCGCTVVGSASVPSILYVCSEGSGTVALSRRTGDLCDALGAEMNLWRNGMRDPEKISTVWKSRVSATAVARRFLSLVEPA